MSDITIPPPLNTAESAFKIATEWFDKISDSAKRKTIAEDIKSFHALNETEAKKAQESRDLIKQHTAVLEETRKLSEETKKASFVLASEKMVFEEEKRIEYAKIADAKLPANEALVRAQQLHDDTKKMQDDIATRESALKEEKQEHANAVLIHQENVKELALERKKLKEQKQSILDLDSMVRAKVEALKKFNF